MTYRHETHEAYDHFIVQHTEETTTPSGLILSRHIGITNISLEKAPSIGELVVSSEMPGIDPSGFLHNPSGSFDTLSMLEAAEPIADKAIELGSVASVAIMLFAPNGNPELVSQTDKELFNRFKAVLTLELGRKSVTPTDDPIGD